VSFCTCRFKHIYEIPAISALGQVGFVRLVPVIKKRYYRKTRPMVLKLTSPAKEGKSGMNTSTGCTCDWDTIQSQENSSCIIIGVEREDEQERAWVSRKKIC
jgi:hypothetical protein